MKGTTAHEVLTLFWHGLLLVPQEQFSPYKTPLPLQTQPVTFPLAAAFSLQIHCDLHEKFTAGGAIDCKISKLYLSVVVANYFQIFIRKSSHSPR